MLSFTFYRGYDIINMTNKFDESKHPRDKEGKFTSKQENNIDGLINKYSDTPKEDKESMGIKLPDETIPKSVGAKWVNEEIYMPDGSKAKFVEGSKITHKEVFAGKGTKTPIRDIERLVKEYPGSKTELWQKVKGRAEIDWKGEQIKADVHWYEEPSIGRVEVKFKKEL